MDGAPTVPGPNPGTGVLGEWWVTVKNLLLPVFCKVCGVRLLTEENGAFCPGCWEAIPRIAPPFCTGCGKPHEAVLGYGIPNNFPCQACREKPNPHIGRIYGAALYVDALELAVKTFKFHDRPMLSGALGELMATFAESYMDCRAYDFLVPVPLHKVRLRHRGYNQSALLAAQLAPLFAPAVVDESLWRIRPTRTQSRLQAKARRQNVRGAFAVKGNPYEGASVLLIDDVVTSAGTVTECAKALRRSGARRVDVFATALAAPHRTRAERLL